VLLAVFLAALVSGLWGQGFWGIHGEGRRAEVGREVYEEGRWLVPTLLGEPFITKPPLLYWAIAGTFRLSGGVSEFRARLPGVAATAGTLLLVMALARALALQRTGGRSEKAAGAGLADEEEARRCGLAAGLAFAANPLVLGMGRQAETEPLLLFFSTLSVYCFVKIRPGRDGSPVDPWRLLLPVCLTAGFLVKGPLGWLFPLFGMGTLEALSPSGGRRLRWVDGLYFLLATAVLALPWFAAVAQRVPGALETWLGESVARLDPEYATHREPFWYYVPRIASFGPWVALLPVLLYGLPGAYRRRELGILWPLLWFLVGVAFLSLATSKRTHYMLSLAPAYALGVAPLLARGLQDSAVGRGLATALRALLWLLPAGMLAAGVYLGIAQRTVGAAQTAVLVLGAGGMACYVWKVRRVGIAWVLATALCASAAVAGVGVLPAVDAYRSPRAFFEEVRAIVGPTAPVWNWQTDRFSSSFYLGRHVWNLTDADELRQAAPGGAWLVTSGRVETPLPPGAEVVHVRESRDPFRPNRRQRWLLLRWSPEGGA
jgi:4-amino-4-deoxy-L-arabinose transferase-like glycosyltransferase